MRTSRARYPAVALLSFGIGMVVGFALDGFEWKGFGELFPSGAGALVAGLGLYHYQKKRTQ